MVSRKIFVAAVAILAVQRLLELQISKRNEKRILEKGGQEFFPAQIRVMKILHTAWFGSMLFEVFQFKRPFIPVLSTIAAVLLVIGQSLRYSAIRTLRERWTVKLMSIPGAAP
ncbi:MAG: isoprenylcysteine carboxyl methyltransferase, partial [Chloroflexi bacterium]